MWKEQGVKLASLNIELDYQTDVEEGCKIHTRTTDVTNDKLFVVGIKPPRHQSESKLLILPSFLVFQRLYARFCTDTLVNSYICISIQLLPAN